MSIYIFEASELDRRYLSEYLAGEELKFIPGPLTNISQLGSNLNDIEALCVFVHSRVDATIIDSLPNLRLVATRSTSYDHINVPACESRGVPVSTVPTYGENTVAEHTFALILALSRNIHKAYMRTSSGDFSLVGLQGFDLKGKTIGIIGVGHIGLHTVQIAKGFGMNVIAHDPVPNPTAAEILGYQYTHLDDLLSRSDIVSLHATYSKATHHMIGEHNIGRIKRGALLINTARGELVDTCALLKALDDGVLRGAGLDVVEGEEVFSEEKQLIGNQDASSDRLRMALRNLSLLKRPDLIVTPHIAFDSSEAMKRILATTVENIRGLRTGCAMNTVHT